MALTAIDVGCDNQTGMNNGGTGHTQVNLSNPSNATGLVTSVTVYCVGSVEGLVVGTVYGSGTSWTKRDSETIGNASTGANTFTGLSIDVSTNDCIGEYHSSGKVYYSQGVGGNGYIYKISTNTFGLSGAQTYTADTATGIQISVYGTGTTFPGAPTSVSATTNLTDKTTISWTTGAEEEDGNHVYRGSTDLGNVAHGTSTYDDTGGTAGVIYSYTVKSITDGYLSVASSAVNGIKNVSSGGGRPELRGCNL